jgi:hypothetical protein
MCTEAEGQNGSMSSLHSVISNGTIHNIQHSRIQCYISFPIVAKIRGIKIIFGLHVDAANRTARFTATTTTHSYTTHQYNTPLYYTALHTTLHYIDYSTHHLGSGLMPRTQQTLVERCYRKTSYCLPANYGSMKYEKHI